MLRDGRDVFGASVEQQIAVVLAARGVKRKQKSRALNAYVNWGRWVADCACGSGIDCTPGLSGVCLECGSEYRITFPPEIDAIDLVLTKRPERFRNWTPGETVAHLDAENSTRNIR